MVLSIVSRIIRGRLTIPVYPVKEPNYNAKRSWICLAGWFPSRHVIAIAGMTWNWTPGLIWMKIEIFDAMIVTPTHINYYHVCQRKLWLFAHGIQMEHTSDAVAEGKLIHETSYPQRAAKYTEIKLPDAVIDFYDAKRKEVHEVKKSDKIEQAHIAQVKYYLFLLKKAGIDGVKGIIEYPKLRKTEGVILTSADEIAIGEWKREVERIAAGDCPDTINRKFCRQCSYWDLCYG